MGKKVDIIISIFLIIVSVIIFTISSSLPSQSAMFPRIIAGIMTFLSLILIITSIRSNGISESSNDNIFWVDVIKGIGIILFYILTMPILGFFFSTSIFIILFMISNNEKSIKKLLATVAILNIFIYMIFVLQLNVPLPKGFFI